MANLIKPRVRDIMGLPIQRILPSLPHQGVGPFIFLDHLGPVSVIPTASNPKPPQVNVPSHPHIGLSTVTFLFPGSPPIMHRDSLGTMQLVRPGEMNLMASGRGIVHSERPPKKGEDGFGELGDKGILHGLQLWTAHPKEKENDAPWFAHYGKEQLPKVGVSPSVNFTVLMGHLPNLGTPRSPVRTYTPSLYVIVELGGARSELELDVDALRDEGYDELGIYAVDEPVSVSGASEPSEIPVQHMKVVMSPLLVGDRPSKIKIAPTNGADMSITTVVLLGGQKVDGHRHLDWNFVASTKELNEAAREDWKKFVAAIKEGRQVDSGNRFQPVPGDSETAIPLP